LSLSPQIKDEYASNLTEKSIEIIGFALMPNHFHFLLKQTDEKGIMNFLRLFENSYTRYFNLKHGRIGHLFQGQFKSVHIETTEQLLHVSRYIHLNPLTSGVVTTLSELEKYPWTSYPTYLNEIKSITELITTTPIFDEFQTIEKYRTFVSDQSEYQQELDLIKHLTLEI